jgi:hypothetical protein
MKGTCEGVNGLDVWMTEITWHEFEEEEEGELVWKCREGKNMRGNVCEGSDSGKNEAHNNL